MDGRCAQLCKEADAEVSCIIERMHVDVGGLSRSELAEQLTSSGVLLNVHAETLLSSAIFDRQRVVVVDLVVRSVADLGLTEGATLSAIFTAAQNQGLALCPAESGPYLRLALADQVEAADGVMTAGRAPSGSLTIASAPLDEDDEYPKGFYLRVIAGQSWLRGYRCDDEHVWSPDDCFVFRSAESPKTVVQKVVCYVVHEAHLLVFTHDKVSIEIAGVQVPAGTIEPGESAEAAAVREVLEETGLKTSVVTSLGQERYDITPSRREVAERHFFRLSVDLPAHDPHVAISARWAAADQTLLVGSEAFPERTCWWLPVEHAHVLAAGLGARIGSMYG